jgi:hypothetical protein
MSIDNDLLIYQHLGLGDHIICNGLVREISRDIKIKLFVKQQNIINMQIMYSDNRNISIVPVIDDYEARVLCNSNNCLRIGFCTGAPLISNIPWDQMFYIHGNVPFDYSWSRFYYPKNIEKENNTYNKIINNSTDYAFVHSTGSDGNDCIDYSVIDPKLTIVKSDQKINLFSYIKILENASEIHCINSAFIHLIDRLDNINSRTKLFYHKNFKLKPFSNFTLKKHWTII